jgi:hypothetical protein
VSRGSALNQAWEGMGYSCFQELVRDESFFDSWAEYKEMEGMWNMVWMDYLRTSRRGKIKLEDEWNCTCTMDVGISSRKQASMVGVRNGIILCTNTTSRTPENRRHTHWSPTELIASMISSVQGAPITLSMSVM